MSLGRSGPGRRAVVRWAWRLFRKEWRQQFLVLALITLAVAAAVAWASVAVNASSAAPPEFGDATAITHIDATDPKAALARVAAARRRFGPLEVVAHTAVAVPGSVEPLDLRSQDPHGRFGRPTLGLRSGRYPTRADEVALTGSAADLLSTGLGRHVRLGGIRRTVVGLVENPSDLADRFALVRAGSLSGADSLTLLLGSDRPRDLPRSGDGPTGTGTTGRSGDTTAGTTATTTRSGDTTAGTTATTAGSEGTSKAGGATGSGGARNPGAGGADVGFAVMATGSGTAAVVAVVLVATALAMALVSLIATAGFAVVAQRRQRQLGLLAAIGATERHLRLAMLADGALVGLAAAVVGGVVGVLGWLAAAPAVESAAGHRIDRFDLPWTLIGACLALAVAMSVAAAWWPARAVARRPVVAALSRRPAPATPVHRSAVLAVALVVAGMVAIAGSDPTGTAARAPVLIGGVLALVVGVVLASPAAIRALAAPAGRLPFAARLALRDLVRYESRASAALAAITLGLGIAVSVVVLAGTSVPKADGGNLSDRTLVVRAGDPRTAPDPALPAADRARLDAAAARVAAAMGLRGVLPLDVAINPSTSADRDLREPVSLIRPVAHGGQILGYPFVATPALLHRLGIDPGAIHPATDLLTERERVALLDITVRPGRGRSQTTVQRVGLPAYTSMPGSLVTPQALRRHGWVRARAAWVVESPRPLTGDQIAAARRAAASAGLTVEVRTAQDGVRSLRDGATAVGSLLALAIAAMTIGLLRGEAGRDLRTLTATGASARTRRAVTAATAGALALLGVLLGTAGAYLAVVAAYHAELGKLLPVPAVHLLLLAIGLPAVAIAGGWLLAGREPPGFSRESLD